MSRLQSVLDRVDASLQASMDRWFDLLRIPSISADPAHAGDCRRAADWLAQMLADMGLQAAVEETGGHPVVLAQTRHAARTAPRVLFYGHYDVQPVEPRDAWESDPFTPEIRTGPDGRARVYARGAADDKGQLLTFLEALRAWMKAHDDRAPFPVTILLEGEEEIGSPSLDRFLQSHTPELRADLALVCDTNQWDAETPAITTRLRGIVHDEVVIRGPNADLHSGLYGGPVPNPLHVLAHIVNTLWDEDGRVTLEGFYEGVAEIPAALRRQWAALDMNDARLLAEVGLEPPAVGEKGYTALEKIWARPTAEVNGMGGGHMGPGAKTVIPAEAFLKISFRLVGRQNPERVREAFRHHVRQHLPSGFEAHFAEVEAGAPAIEIPEDSKPVKAAAAALQEEWEKTPVFMGCGGSIPVVGSFRRVLGLDSLLVGFGLPDDSIHAPNEKYDVTCFHKGIRSWIRIMTRLADVAD